MTAAATDDPRPPEKLSFRGVIAKLPAAGGALVLGALQTLPLLAKVLLAAAWIALYWLVIARPLQMRGSRRALGIVVTLALIPYALGALWLGLTAALWLGLVGWLVLLFALRRADASGSSASTLVATSAACAAGFALGFSIDPVKRMISPPHVVDVHVTNKCADDLNLKIGPVEIGSIAKNGTRVAGVPAVVVHLQKSGTSLEATGGIHLTATLSKPFNATMDGQPISSHPLELDLGSAKTHSLVVRCGS